jgi:hypothetical protein
MESVLIENLSNLIKTNCLFWLSYLTLSVKYKKKRVNLEHNRHKM